jgi:hypothetical protein
LYFQLVGQIMGTTGSSFFSRSPSQLLRLGPAALFLAALFVDQEGAQAQTAFTQPTAGDTTVVVKRGESLLSIAADLLERSDHYTAAELAIGMRHLNELESDRLLPGQVLTVPLRRGPAQDQPRRIVDPRPARGIYATALVAGSPRMMALADALVAVGGNTVVFDIKDREGDLSFLSSSTLARQTQVDSLASIQRPAALVDQLHRRDLHVVGRLSCFYDERLAAARPDLAPRLPDGHPWEAGWLDPANTEVQAYLLSVVDEMVTFGIDEVQLDYVRFPTESAADSAVFAYAASLSRDAVITDFVRQVRNRLAGSGVLLAADVFGVAAWGRSADRDRIGQYLPDLLPLLDIASPMLYPSHFYGNFLGLTNPVDYPYYLVYEGVRRMVPLAQAHGVAVRPWVQSFPYRIPEFDEAYVAEQMQGAADAGADGCMLWHPASRYDVGLSAMRQVIDGVVVPRPDRMPQLLGVPTVMNDDEM